MRFFFILTGSSLILFSCVTPQKVNRLVAKEYNNTLPKQDRKKNTGIIITSPLLPGSDVISATEKKTSHMLPLLFYWQWDYINTCSLNPAIAINNFSTTLYTQTNRGLNKKLNGEKLELTVEQIPNVFAFVDKAHMIWVVYAFGWDKIFVQPDAKDLIVSYKVSQNGNEIKSGKISIKNTEQNKGVRFFQSWKSAISEYLALYNQDVTNMSKAFVTKLIEEL